MKITSKRIGFATNSSSTHSIVFVPSQAGVYELDSAPWDEFGWEWFLLTEKEDKCRYLAVAHKNCLSEEERLELYGITGEEGYIDHDSEGLIQTTSDIDKAKEYRDWICQDNIAIRGGNDNCALPDEYKDLVDTDLVTGAKEGEVVKLDYNTFLRKDRGVITTFNPLTGSKVRFSLEDSPPDYSLFPELADVKITDFCRQGCSYCYQGSTPEGLHGDLKDIKHVIDELSSNGAFEIAFGGGETTDHPDFKEILEYTKSKNLVPNFTTRSAKWMKDKDLAKVVCDCVGGFAVSVDTLTELKAYHKAVKRAEDKHNKGVTKWCDKVNIERKMTVQLVMGAVTKSTFIKICDYCSENNIGLTLLGYKTTGRGSEVKPKDYSYWLDIISSYKETKSNYGYSSTRLNLKLGIDTELALQFKDKLSDYGINREYYSTKEGTYSCYIDAVSMQIAPSSYEEDQELYKDFDKDWLDYYQKTAILRGNTIDVKRL